MLRRLAAPDGRSSAAKCSTTPAGALFRWSWIDMPRAWRRLARIRRIVVAVDPNQCVA